MGSEPRKTALAAYKAAAAAGYAIELDVRLSSDHRLVVIHDRNTRRLTRHDFTVADTPAAQLTKLRLQGTAHTIPPAARRPSYRARPGAGTHRNKVSHPRQGSFARSWRRRSSATAARWRWKLLTPRVLVWFRRQRAPTSHAAKNAGSLPEYTSVPRWIRSFLCGMPLNLITRPNFIVFDLRDFPSRRLLMWEHVFHIPVLLWTVRTKRHLATARDENFNVIFERIRP